MLGSELNHVSKRGRWAVILNNCVDLDIIASPINFDETMSTFEFSPVAADDPAPLASLTSSGTMMAEFKVRLCRECAWSVYLNGETKIPWSLKISGHREYIVPEMSFLYTIANRQRCRQCIWRRLVLNGRWHATECYVPGGTMIITHWRLGDAMMILKV